MQTNNKTIVNSLNYLILSKIIAERIRREYDRRKKESLDSLPIDKSYHNYIYYFIAIQLILMFWSSPELCYEKSLQLINNLKYFSPLLFLSSHFSYFSFRLNSLTFTPNVVLLCILWLLRNNGMKFSAIKLNISLSIRLIIYNFFSRFLSLETFSHFDWGLQQKRVIFIVFRAGL